ncbi:MAG: RnfABCDGE type electron transport complex subunit D [Methylococcaceae bacterium]|nr:MAG: RnfABCDGE type electron transport complex subunit D [Methylococcaceae bacterium]
MKPILSAPFSRDDTGVSAIMRKVLLALTPATVIGLLLFGWPALFLFVVTVGSALLWEALCLLLAGKAVRPTLLDYSALLTGWLVALSLPPWAPWWIGVTGSFIAIVVGKQVYGGLGQNLFNPAMLARVALLVSFPLEMTTWVNPLNAPGWADSWTIAFGGDFAFDSYTGATLLGHLKTEFSQGRGLSAAYASGGYGTLASWFGVTRGSLGETSAIALAGGGLWLLRQKVITWHIPVSLLATVIVLASLFTLIDGERYPGPLFHLGSGALMLVAFFIATDYVTSPSSPLGQLLFGAGCGAIIFLIRTWGAFPEGAGFAVLLMNSLTPVIDHYVRPRIYGRDLKGRPLELEGSQ